MAISASIAVTNESTVLSDEEVLDMCMAVQHQANYHFAPFWHVGCRMHLVAPKMIPVGMIHIAIVDDADQAGVLGYHDVDENFVPEAFVFAGTDKQYGLSSSCTLSHETLETLGDLRANEGVQVGQDWYANEACDPCEDDSQGYEVKTAGMKTEQLVSDFILLNWFDPSAPKKYDYRGHISKPLEILSGGYAAIFKFGKGWTQVTNFDGQMVEKVQADPLGKRERPSMEIRHQVAEHRRGNASTK